MKTAMGFLAIALAIALAPLPAMSAEGRVSRGQFTSAILDREPVDEITSIDSTIGKIFFFTELRNLEDTTITHRWTHAGEVKAEIEFKVRGSRWRVYSSKTLLPEWIGDWKVEVLSEEGTVLGTYELKHSGS
jgi:hypothetical protein